MWRTRCALPTLTVAPTKKSNLTDKRSAAPQDCAPFLNSSNLEKIRASTDGWYIKWSFPCLAALGWSPAAKVARLLIIVGVTQLLFNMNLRR